AWYNAHPDFCDLDIDLDVASVAVIGNGNVAIDVARVLAKTHEEMLRSDIADYAAEKIHRAPIRAIHIFGRRGPLEASFTPKELGELGELADCTALVDPAQLPAIDGLRGIEPVVKKNLAHLQAFATNKPGSKRKSLYLHFYARPVAVLGSGRVSGLRLERTRVEDGACIGTGETFDLACGLVVPCIGYRSQAIEGVPYDERRGRFVNDRGTIAAGLFCTGWARRGPSGTIGTNRTDAFEVAETIMQSLKPSGKAGGDGLDALIRARGLEPVFFADWKRIEAAEEAAAAAGAPRHKFASRAELIAAARQRET
ncbi:MAG: pyridine nucleotide-disulfide oxidoreductase, partial [Alphaproteobacteria bacterium]